MLRSASGRACRGPPALRARAECRRTRRRARRGRSRQARDRRRAHRLRPESCEEYLRRVEAKRLDVPTLVRLAVRADTVHLLRLPARRADLEVRDGDPVLSATLVAARPRCLSLRNGHERLVTIAAGRAPWSPRSVPGSGGRATRLRASLRSRGARFRAARPPP